MQNKSISITLDLGYSSIGWSAFAIEKESPKVLGCGVVLFPSDDCLASERRTFRRSRRNIRARRNRIKRIRNLLLHLGVLSAAKLDQHPSPISSPWYYAARVLASEGKETLTWLQLWAVLRWYAHNRGYDGNKRWAKDEIDETDDEDLNEDEVADQKMCSAAQVEMNRQVQIGKSKHPNMAETLCAMLDIDPMGDKKSTHRHYKVSDVNARLAFPRKVVAQEVKNILSAHIGILPKVDASLIEALVGDSDHAYRAIPCDAIRLPSRYEGSLLFGQYVPRFNNRIITPCRITGGKTPLKHCREYYYFRWAQVLANIRVKESALPGSNIRPLTSEERIKLTRRLEAVGYFSKASLEVEVLGATGLAPANIESYFLTEDSEEALVLNPVLKAVSNYKAVWDILLSQLQKRFAGKIFKGQRATPQDWRNALAKEGGDLAAFDKAIESLLPKSGKERKAIDSSPEAKAEAIQGKLKHRVKAKAMEGRAPYCRELLVKAYNETLEGKDPHETGGCLCETKAVIEKNLNTPLEKLTNNHLVRHRILIMERLLKDIVKEYAAGDKKSVGQVVVEVAKDIQEYSGMNSKKRAQLFGQKTAHHHKIVKYLESEIEKIRAEGGNISISAGLIRKARIADDLGWVCPFTGKSYDVINLPSMEWEHIVPRSLRPSDALSSLVLTWKEVNIFKGQRTGLEFVTQEAGKPVPGNAGLSIRTPDNYKQWVNKLETFKGADDDKKRKRKRQELLLLGSYNKREGEFTERDLTITSHINKLAAQRCRLFFKDAETEIRTIPGQVTAATRKAWRMEECYREACPSIFEKYTTGEGKTASRAKTKTEIREITHLHHALDAATLGLTAMYFPNKTEIYQLMLKRNFSDQDINALRLRCPWMNLYRSETGEWRLEDVPANLKSQITKALAEKRVVQHVPASMDGMSVDQTTWGIKPECRNNDGTLKPLPNGKIALQQRTIKDGRSQLKFEEEKPMKLLGNANGKLRAIKGATLINGNYGIAYWPEKPEIAAEIIPFFKVAPKIKDLAMKAEGLRPTIIRNGYVIDIASGDYKGSWRVASCKDDSKLGLLLDLYAIEKVKPKDTADGFRGSARLKTIIKSGLKVRKSSYTGSYSPCPTTSSQ